MNRQGTPNRTNGIATTSVIVAIILVGLVAAGTWMVNRDTEQSTATGEGDIAQVERGSFDITVPTSGELAALRQIEIKSQLDGRAVITEIVAEGTRVEPGSVLVKFNDEQILENIKDAEDGVDTARNDLDNAQANLEIRTKARESQLAAADLSIRLNDLALKSWMEGTDVTNRQQRELRVKTAEKEFERAKARFDAAARLLERDFISEDDYKRDEITLLRAESDLDQAKLDLDVYNRYDSVRLREEAESDLKQAQDERERLQGRLDAEVRSAESDVRSRQRRLDSRTERLEKWQNQLTKCVLTAPSGGLVVYASSLESGGWGRRDESPPDVGSEVHPNRTIMILPDVSQMVAAVKVNEALSGMIQPGQRASIVADALPDTPIQGEVLSVGVLAESGGWRDPNRRDYTVRVLLDKAADMGLKPSMRCRSSIAVGRVDEALHVPVQAIFREAGVAYVYVPDGNGYAQRSVEVGRSSELYVEIIDGLSEGDSVLLREPTASEITERIDFESVRGDQAYGRSGRPSGARGQKPGSDKPKGKPGAGESGSGESGSGKPSSVPKEKQAENAAGA